MIGNRGTLKGEREEEKKKERTASREDEVKFSFTDRSLKPHIVVQRKYGAFMDEGVHCSPGIKTVDGQVPLVLGDLN